MPVTVVANLTVLDAVSKQVISQQIYPMSINIVVLLIGIVGNITVMLSIAMTKPLRTGAFRILGGLSTADLIYALSQLYLQSYTIYMYLNRLSGMESQYTCIARIYSTLASSLASQLLTVVVACDRFCAIVFPVGYRVVGSQVKFRYVTVVCFVLGFGVMGFMFLLHDGTQMLVNCSPLGAPDPTFINAYNYAQLLLSVLVLILSSTMAFIMIRRLKAIDSIGERHQMRRQLDVGTCKTICIIAVVYLSTWIGSTLCHNVLIRILTPVEYLMRYPYCATFAVTYPASHVFVYLTMSRLFRKSYLRVICRRERPTSTIVSVSGQKVN